MLQKRYTFPSPFSLVLNRTKNAAPNCEFGGKPLIQLASVSWNTLIIKTSIKIGDVLSYSDLQAIKNTSGKKHLTLGYRTIQLFNAFLQYLGQIDLLSNY